MASIKTDPFQAAVNKAQALHPAVVEHLGMRASVQTFSVQASTRGTWYEVHSGPAGCTCSCKAAQQGRVCYHRAAVLLHKLANDAADLFLAALDASIQSQEDAQLQAAVGAWWTKTYGDLTAQEVLDAEEEREEAAFWADFNASRETIISAVMLWVDGYLPKEQPMECKKCGRRCNGQTGLCYRCEQEQRKAEAAKREQAPMLRSEREFSIFKTA